MDKARGISRDDEIGRDMDEEDLHHLKREEASQRLKLGIDQGEKRRILEDMAGERGER
jgi:hypothetical protein